MKTDELINPPMTAIETMLKSCLSQRPDIRDKIPTSEEFVEYIQWMIEEFGGRPEYQLPRSAVMDLSFNLAGNKISDIGNRLMADPHDAQALDAISEEYETFSEDLFVSDDCDISVGRMLRYLPSHWHRNDHFQVFVSFSGECPFYFINETVILKPGAVLIIAPGIYYASPCFQDDCSLLFYVIRSSTFDRVFWNQIPPENLMASFFRQALSESQLNAYLQFETGGDRDVLDLLTRIYSEFMEGKGYRAQMMNALISEFFIILLRRYEGTARLPRSEDFFWKHEYSAILSYIQAHYATVKLPELSERFHYNEKQIRRIVQNSTGMSFVQLLTKLRMERAAALLKRGNIPIEKIANAVGYTTLSGFYRTFSLYFHCTPKQYIEENAK